MKEREEEKRETEQKEIVVLFQRESEREKRIRE